MVTVDLLGHGRSDRPDDPLEYSMTAFGEQVLACSTPGIDQAVVGGTSLGANVSLEVAVLAPERVRGIIAEMPVLDNALEAGILTFAPLLFPSRFAPLHHQRPPGSHPRRAPRGGAVLDRDRAGHLRPAPGPMAAAIHGIFFGRIAPLLAAAQGIGCRRWSWVTRRPVHPAADAAMLAEELTDCTFVGARGILEWRYDRSG